MSKKINGKTIAQKILDELKKKVKALNSIPTLAIILVGRDPASRAYVQQKVLAAKEIGAKATLYSFPSNISFDKLLRLLKKLNNDSNVHGIIVQRPLPNHIDSDLINKAINPKKDVDAFNPLTKFQSPITKAVLRILEEIFIATPRRSRAYDLRGWLQKQKIVVIGKGETGGGPIIKGFKELGLKPHVIDTKTINPELITHNADIVISAVGKPNIVTQEIIKNGVALLSVGLHKGNDSKLHGDYNENKIKNKASFYTPTPGGVGPVNVACLLENLVIAAHNSN